MVSFDGFRHDYVQNFEPPTFQQFIREGASAKSLIPSFPTKTFPNHYTLVTGLYPANHGLVDNSFYDPAMDTVYTMRDRGLVENAHFYGGTPLWQLVQENGLKSASYFWVGSEAPVKGQFPNYFHIYDGQIPNETRIESTINWLKLPDSERPRFISLYFSLVDSQGHATGPNAVETKESVLEADRLLELLWKEVKQLNLSVNIVVVSDHGMHEMSNTPDMDIYLDTLFQEPAQGFRMVNNRTHTHLFFEDSTRLNESYEALKAKELNYTVFKQADVPKHLHYSGSDRIGDVVIIARPGFSLLDQPKRMGAMVRGKKTGTHGFDPIEDQSMHGIFYAWGPNVKVGARVEPIENIHVYPLVCAILGIDPPSNIDGKLDQLKEVLKL